MDCRNIDVSVTKSARFLRMGFASQALYHYMHGNLPRAYVGTFDEEHLADMFGGDALAELEGKGYVILDRVNGLYFMPNYFEANHFFWATPTALKRTIEEMRKIRDSFLFAVLFHMLSTRKPDKADHPLPFDLASFKEEYPQIFEDWSEDLQKLGEVSLKRYVEWKNSGGVVASL